MNATASLTRGQRAVLEIAADRLTGLATFDRVDGRGIGGASLIFRACSTRTVAEAVQACEELTERYGVPVWLCL